ncbi:MAG: TIM barrel protein [Anaerolineales bacterium]|nr:TIM barrel protein [Anaerolineales bacterium]
MIQIANAPCSWGVIENIAGERGGYVQVLNEMAETGYAGTELGDWGFMPTDTELLRQELASRHLQLLASWVSVHLEDARQHKQSADDCVRTAKQLAAVGGPDNAETLFRFIVLGNDPYGNPLRTKNAGRVTPALAMDKAMWQVFAQGANYVAQRVMDEAGLRTVFHHHVGTWVETPAETKHFLEMTNPKILGLCFDTGHWKFGGGDPVSGVYEFKERIWHVHFKDHQPQVAAQSRVEEWDGPTSVGHGIFCELGKGDVDFPGVLKALNDIGYAGWIVVEQDVLPGMGTPKESAARNRAYLSSIGL